MIITIGREFGSGGREVGKRLAEYLGVPCYDKEIINEVAKLQGISAEYVEKISDSDVRVFYQSTVGHSFSAPMMQQNGAIDVLIQEQKVIKNLAKQGDCVIVGRCADIILKDMNPLNIFVYANQECKIKRCLERMREDENEKSIIKQMKKIDKIRARNRNALTGSKFGERESYHLLINTSNIDIKSIIPSIASFALEWFKMQNNIATK